MALRRHQRTKALWAGRLRKFLPSFMRAHAALRGVAARADAVLHGSTALGIDDAVSDLDLWLLLGEPALRKLDRESATRFFEFKLCGKPGHLNATSADEFGRRIGRCDMNLIAEARDACVIVSHLGRAAGLLARARKPMSDRVRRAFFFHHYVELRGLRTSFHNPIVRHEAAGVLLLFPQALGEALRAAMVLDGEPYPYDKWLPSAAKRTPTGRLVARRAEGLLDALASDAMRFKGPVARSPIYLALADIRDVLIRAARRNGIDEPWLAKWWFHMDASRAAVDKARW